MEYMPSVTMNGGSFHFVMSRPLAQPTNAPTAKPARIASETGTPCSTASLPMTMLLRAMIIPQLRSMPAVRTISVCAMAITPTKDACWRIRLKVPSVRKRSDWKVKNRQAISRAIRGPRVLRCGSWKRRAGVVVGCVMLMGLPGQ
ncbi:hypothetical protein GCM10010842_25500 [Deinococcus daejeonensis]|uniref:Uncharacterized protein n=1 Tax=Deinococcus daejeonensis TaxID=1007098 RepID=A0ABQ2J8X3_9DEIO|nr:hypothetical protein GCM10010842_25500 [Deinococcus daejeonensis]